MKLIDLSLIQLLSAYIFVVILIVFLKAKGVKREIEVAIASLRMTIQLTLAGYILTYILNNPKPIYTIIAIAIMEMFGIYNVFKRVKLSLPKPVKIKLETIVAISMTTGTLLSFIYFFYIVIGVSPWFNPRYIIPLAGMIIGNSMTGIALAVKNLAETTLNQRDIIETALMLGAHPKDAIKDLNLKAFDSAILPTINTMVGMGIVFLPGMMTGQILSGISPIIAIKYQIAIMLGILGGVAISIGIFFEVGYKAFFNKEHQLLI